MTGTTYIKKARKLAVEVPALFIGAPCQGENTPLFYSYNQESDPSIKAYKARLAKARTICGTCPIARACARQARTLPRSAQFGIWAGRDMHLDPHETPMAKRYRDRHRYI